MRKWLAILTIAALLSSATAQDMDPPPELAYMAAMPADLQRQSWCAAIFDRHSSDYHLGHELYYALAQRLYGNVEIWFRERGVTEKQILFAQGYYYELTRGLDEAAFDKTLMDCSGEMGAR